MNDTIYVYRPGRLPELLDRIGAAAEADARVVVDLHDVERLDDATTRELIVAMRRTRTRNVDFVVRGANAVVDAALRAMALDRVFHLERAA